MGFYQRWILPRLLDVSMRREDLSDYRGEVVGRAHGRVLEIGIGSGLNLPYYGAATEGLFGIDPSPELLQMTKERSAKSAVRVRLLEGSSEQLPVESKSVDSIVMTWVLCTIPDPAAALSEMRRVLKPGGELCFIEHGRAPDTNVARWQDRLDPLWKRISGGCHLNRPTDKLLESAGFRLEGLKTFYHTKGPKMLGFMYRGQARSV